jgi:carbonic anhydrase
LAGKFETAPTKLGFGDRHRRRNLRIGLILFGRYPAQRGYRRKMSATDEYLKNNEEYAKTFSGPLPLPPSRHVAVVACMDARLDVYRILGLGDGEAHVIRNAGGVITDDEIRSLAISQRLLGTKEIILIHHTDCGMLTFTDDDFKRAIQDDTGIKPAWAAEAFADLEEDVRQSLRRIEASPFVTKHESLRGFVFDVATGRLNEVNR